MKRRARARSQQSRAALVAGGRTDEAPIGSRPIRSRTGLRRAVEQPGTLLLGRAGRNDSKGVFRGGGPPWLPILRCALQSREHWSVRRTHDRSCSSNGRSRPTGSRGVAQQPRAVLPWPRPDRGGDRHAGRIASTTRLAEAHYNLGNALAHAGQLPEPKRHSNRPSPPARISQGTTTSAWC